jgi:hypothetical protein
MRGPALLVSGLPAVRHPLKRGGALVVNVAAMRVLHGRHALLSEEARRYTREELRVKLAAAGFTIASMTHTNATLPP